jgi:hypothetical protein
MMNHPLARMSLSLLTTLLNPVAVPLAITTLDLDTPSWIHVHFRDGLKGGNRAFLERVRRRYLGNVGRITRLDFALPGVSFRAKGWRSPGELAKGIRQHEQG